MPDSIVDPTARADYAATHFWRQFAFADTTLLRPDYAEQALSDFLTLLRYASPEARQQAVDGWLDMAEGTPRTYHYFAEEAERYLYDAHSPLRDEGLCQLVVAHVARSAVAGEGLRSRARFLQELLARNGVGQPATDFSYETADGSVARLAATAADRQLALLFYDADCQQCRDAVFRLRYCSPVNLAIAEGRLAVLAVCVEGDRGQWLAARGDLPPTWIVGRDLTGLRDHALYDLQALPVLYLLDADKRVVLKNAGVEQLYERFLP